MLLAAVHRMSASSRNSIKKLSAVRRSRGSETLADPSPSKASSASTTAVALDIDRTAYQVTGSAPAVVLNPELLSQDWPHTLQMCGFDEASSSRAYWWQRSPCAARRERVQLRAHSAVGSPSPRVPVTARRRARTSG